MSIVMAKLGLRDRVWFTVHQGKGNKMENKTSVMMNHTPKCFKRSRIKGTVCSRCYSLKLSSYRKDSSMRKYMEHNSVILSSEELHFSILRTIDNTIRYNSTGDNHTSIEVYNIFHHARINAHLHGAVWTKEYGLYKRVMSAVKPPSNLVLIWSHTCINCMKFIIPKDFTKSFYVYSSEDNLKEAQQKAISEGFNVFECQRKCVDCQHCYVHKGKTIVMERLR